MSSTKRAFASSPTPSNTSFKKRRYDGPPPAAVVGLAKHLAGQVNQVVEWLKVSQSADGYHEQGSLPFVWDG
jgi:hypothetical protein